jgi:hypothetical protein
LSCLHLKLLHRLHNSTCSSWGARLDNTSAWLPSLVTSSMTTGHVAEPTVGWLHRTVRCAKGVEYATVGFTRKGRRSSTGQELFMSGGALDCPVHHPTKGKSCLPIGSPTAPSCLEAIKGTSRRMEQHTKHSLINLRYLDSAATHLDRYVRDLSTFRVENSCAVFLCSSLGVCTCVCCVLSLACVAFPPLLLCVSCDQ